MGRGCEMYGDGGGEYNNGLSKIRSLREGMGGDVKGWLMGGVGMDDNK
jgi:hypothetical protein